MIRACTDGDVLRLNEQKAEVRESGSESFAACLLLTLGPSVLKCLFHQCGRWILQKANDIHIDLTRLRLGEYVYAAT